MPHLLLVTIGPVQDFIVAARRTRDLRYGSQLLSDLARAAATSLDEQGATLIFPALPLAPGSSAANKLLAIIDRDPKQVARTTRKATLASLRASWQRAQSAIRGKIEQEAAQAQVEDLLEFYWVAVPLSSPEAYPAARRQVEALMAARKTTRDFQPVSWAADRRKSSLDGQRESVLPHGTESWKTERLFREYGARQGEQLSGVDLLKRHGGGSAPVPSTSDIAALPLVLGPLRNAGAAVERYLAALRALGPAEALPDRITKVTGGELLFEARLADYFEGDALKKAQEALKRLLQEGAGGREPLPYYAILQADGDRMGTAIDKLTEQPPASEAIARHQTLSERLGEFVGQARTIISDHAGTPIYLGGDDVLAFLPLHTALACARALADAFRQRFQGPAYRFHDEGVERQPTLSVGLAIVHHLEPLYAALATAREAERQAKRLTDKDALALILDKRGGAPRTLVGRWQPPAGESSLYERLSEFTRLHHDELIAARTAYTLHELALRLPLLEGATDPSSLLDARQKEAMRLLARRRAEGGGAMPEQERALLERFVAEAFGRLGRPEAAGDPLEQLAEEIVVAALLAQAQTLNEEVPS